LPIDSEHSAIFQSLPDDSTSWQRRVQKIILTASGGPFRTRDPMTLKQVTPEQACLHPNWVMGRKISVDSATMMNKALEVIEAHYLFGMSPDQLDVVIHPQSVIHSMVQYRDHYGLSWPERIESGAAALDFQALSAMTFEAMDDPGHLRRFPGIQLAWETLRGTPGSCAVLNAANEVAVDAFLNRRIRFDQIHDVNRSTLDRTCFAEPVSLDGLLALDANSRAEARQSILRLHG
jgi:1-deoxy-D-xylulose-5-phosphate reductoisomerase